MMSSNGNENLVFLKRENSEAVNGNACVPKLWILIEYPTQNGNNKVSIKNYEVVEAKDVYGGRDNTKLEMHTGKIIYVKKDSILVPATIVTISDDKNFLDTELTDLIEMQKTENENQKKRKRTSTPKTDNSVQSQYPRWNGRDSNTSPKKSVIISNPNVQNYPPMTFDQQTQTNFKSDSDYNPHDTRMTKVLMNEENIIRSQHNIALENQEIKQQVVDLGVQLNEMKSMLKEVLTKLDNIGEVRKNTSTDYHDSPSVLNYSQSAMAPVRTINVTNTPRILNLSHQSQTTSQYYSNTSVNLEPIEASNDSNFSLSNNSRMSLSASNQSIYHADINHSQNSLNNSEHITVLKQNQSTTNNIDTYIEEDGSPDAEIVIGKNNTTIPRDVINNINWKSHTAATRRLLRTKFSREVLATHSLTGKPSPGKS